MIFGGFLGAPVLGQNDRGQEYQGKQQYQQKWTKPFHLLHSKQTAHAFLTAEDAEERRGRLEVVDHTLDAVLHLHDIETAQAPYITPAIKHNNPAVGAYCIRPDWAHSSAPLHEGHQGKHI